MYFNKNVINPLLYNLPIKINTHNSHYFTGKNIVTFSNLLCVENFLTNLSCNLKTCVKKQI